MMDKKLTVMEASKLLGVSKEAIYNRLRRGTLNSVIEDGVKYILLGKSSKKELSANVRKSESVIENAYVNLLKEQVESLQAKNERLESDKERLIADKERLLIESKEKIERIYKERDEQLTTILSLANRQITQMPSWEVKSNYNLDEEYIVPSREEAEEADVVEDKEEVLSHYSNWRDLRDYLKEKSLSKKEKNSHEIPDNTANHGESL